MESSVHFLTWGQQRFNMSSVHFSTCFIDLHLWREALLWHPKGQYCWTDDPKSVVLAKARFFQTQNPRMKLVRYMIDINGTSNHVGSCVVNFVIIWQIKNWKFCQYLLSLMSFQTDKTRSSSEHNEDLFDEIWEVSFSLSIDSRTTTFWCFKKIIKRNPYELSG